MHRPDYVRMIQQIAASLDIECTLLTGNWTIQLKKGSKTQYIIGYAFGLNDAACFKIIRNKNVCSEILQVNGIPNVPHELLLSPSIFMRRKVGEGNRNRIEAFIDEHGFPVVLKKNNSSKGEGVFRANTEAEFEDTLAKLYTSEEAICLCPFRKDLTEYRSVILDGECFLTYEKKRPSLVGDGVSTVRDLFFQFSHSTSASSAKPGFYYDNELVEKLDYIPAPGESILLQWKHNRALGTQYNYVEHSEIRSLSVRAAKAVNARFVTVDVVCSPDFGFEIMEINASVSLHRVKMLNNEDYDGESSIYRKAVEKLFEHEGSGIR